MDRVRARPSAVDLCSAATSQRIAADAGAVVRGIEHVLDAGVDGLGAGQREALEAAWRTSRRMLKLSEDLRDLAFAEAGELTPLSGECDVQSVLSAAVAHSWPVARVTRKHIELGVEGRPRAVGDPVLLSRAVHALVEHAVEHALPETTIAVRASEGTLSLVFATDASPLDDPLGLALASAVAKLHGGKLFVEPGRGTTELVLTYRPATFVEAA